MQLIRSVIVIESSSASGRLMEVFMQIVQSKPLSTVPTMPPDPNSLTFPSPKIDRCSWATVVKCSSALLRESSYYCLVWVLLSWHAGLSGRQASESRAWSVGMPGELKRQSLDSRLRTLHARRTNELWESS